jgi:hypothetical protein
MLIKRDENGMIPPWPDKVKSEIQTFVVNGAIQYRIILPLWCPYLPRYRGHGPVTQGNGGGPGGPGEPLPVRRTA